MLAICNTNAMYNTDKRNTENTISRSMEKMDIFLGASFLVLQKIFHNTKLGSKGPHKSSERGFFVLQFLIQWYESLFPFEMQEISPSCGILGY